MDLYTTSFTLPQRPRTHPSRSAAQQSQLPPPNSGEPGPVPPNIPPTPNNITNPPARPGRSDVPSTQVWTPQQVQREWEDVQRICSSITQREGCLVSATKDDAPSSSSPETAPRNSSERPAYNFHISGNYRSVLRARGATMREAPKNHRVVLRAARMDLLETPLAASSTLKPDVQRRLDEIAMDTLAELRVVNPVLGSHGGEVLGKAGVHPDPHEPVQAFMHSDAQTTKRQSGSSDPHDAESSNVSPVKAGSVGDAIEKAASTAPSSVSRRPTQSGPSIGFGLESERQCELIIGGSLESVELAKVRILVMFDELNGLHADVCDIDYKLHPILAQRRRCVIQSIQEETNTNIYFPTPMVGIFDPPLPGSDTPQAQTHGYRNSVMNPLSAQHTGMSSMSAVSMQMGGGMGMGMVHQSGGYQSHMAGSPGPGPIHGHMGGRGPVPPFRGRGSHPVYDPHQHVQWPYSPQPVDVNPAIRPSPYHGPGMNFAPGLGMNGMGSMVGQTPLAMNQSGASQMSHRGSPMSPHHMPGSPGPPFSPFQSFQAPGMMSPQPGVPGHMMPFSPEMGPQGHMGMGMGMSMSGSPIMSTPGGILGQGFGYESAAFCGHSGLGEQGKMGKANHIWITGEFFGVQRARDMLLNAAMQKSRLVISRNATILGRKLDWLLMERLDDLRTIMSDNGTYVSVPPVGSQTSYITVFGDHRVNIERSIRSIMSLACQFYIASFWLLPASFDVLMPQPNLNPAQMQPILKRIAHESGAEVIFKSNCFEVNGTEPDVRAAIAAILELDVIQGFQHEMRFQIELGNEHRDFIAGKKNGKLNKIMKICGVRIKFETFNDYNFLMDISGPNAGTLSGLSMLEEELPAEISFHVPDIYHKRIIGMGGQNIQRIMKLYGVYVKFSNSEEFALLGGYGDNEDNVLARTPAKNAINLDSLKQAIMDTVGPKDKDYVHETILVPRKYHRSLLGEKAIFVHDIEQKTSCVVRFPYKELASDSVTIFGPEGQIGIAAAMLLDHVPFEGDMPLPPNDKQAEIITTTDFITFVEETKRDHQIAISPVLSEAAGQPSIFRFKCQRSNSDALGTAKEALEEFLIKRDVAVYPSTSSSNHTPSQSIASAFAHFNSRLLGSRLQAGNGDAEAVDLRRPRPASVSSDVRALFDGPNADPTAVGAGFAGPLSFRDPRRSTDLWHATATYAGVAGQSRTETDSSGPSNGQPGSGPRSQGAGQGHSQTAQQANHNSRTGANRTQSLDISGLSFSRALGGSGAGQLGPMPPSPGVGPQSASGQYFPAGVGPARGAPESRQTANTDDLQRGLARVSIARD